MRAIRIIYRRELGTYLRSPFGWGIAAILLPVDGILCQGLAMRGELLSAHVLGKFFAALTFLAIMLLLSIYMPIMIKINGKITGAQVVVGYLGMLLLVAA